VRELARRIGCSASLISQVERGLSVPSVGVLYSLASELGCSLDFLLFGTGAEAAPPGAGSGAALAAVPASGGASAQGSAGAFRGKVPVLAPPVSAPCSDGVVQRGCDRRIIDLASGVRWEQLTPGADDRVDFLEVTYTSAATRPTSAVPCGTRAASTA
jgi:hypothetical protein